MLFASTTKISNYFKKLAYFDNFFSIFLQILFIFA